MGTPDFAVPSLERLAREHEVAAVYVRPDAVSGRGKTARPAAVKSAAERLNLAVLQPASLRDPESHGALAALDADFVCVAAYGLILPPAVLEAARFGAVNVHASLLPRWRGAAPIQRAILAGDAAVGVSIMRMESGLDTGPYCLQASTPIAEKGAAQLAAELGEMGAELLLAALPGIAAGTTQWTTQLESDVTYAEKVTKDDVAPSPSLSASENLRRVRASTSAAPARVLLGGRGVTLVDGAVDDSDDTLAPAAVRPRDDGVLLGTAEGVLLVARLKPDGKGAMDAAAWARGARLSTDSVWGSAR
jgi:methionyl-tRNA formyltransferase